ncbi:MAG: SCO family protein [Dongiaceae bacterium]
MLSRSRIARLSVLFCGALTVSLLAALAWQWLVAPSNGPLGSSESGLIRAEFQLIDQHGNTRDAVEFRGQFMLVFFGFTHCPDICPVQLQIMTTALESLGAAADQATPIFITVDPARDTPEVLRDYVANFHPRLVALTGGAAEIGTVARHFRVYYAKATGGQAPADPADYLMDHTAIVYLIGPDGGYLSHFSPGTSAEDMAAGLRKYL